MSIQDVSAEQFAELFHHYHEALAPDFNCNSEQRDESWHGIPDNQRRRLIAAVRLALLDVGSATSDAPSEADSARYFAKPGEAEWGC